MINMPRDRKLGPGPSEMLTNERMKKKFGDSFINVCVMDLKALKEFYGETIMTTENFVNL